MRYMKVSDKEGLESQIWITGTNEKLISNILVQFNAYFVKNYKYTNCQQQEYDH